MSVDEQILMVYKYIVLYFFRTENPELFVEEFRMQQDATFLISAF